MLNEDQLNKLPERITQRLEKVNRHFLELVGKRIQEIGRMSATDIHRIDMMKQVGADMELIKAELAQITGKNAAEIEEIFHIAAKDSVEFSKTIAGDAFIPYEENEQLQRYVQALAEQSAKDYVNMSQNTAFLAMQGGKKVLTSMARRYTDIIDEAILAVTSGQTDFYSAMRRSIKEMADSGIRTKYSPLKGTAGPAADYATGYSRRLDTAVRQNILWGVKQCSQGIQDRVGNSYGADGYEIDYHSNPRPSHAKMGGKQYHKGKGITINGKYFPPFSQVEDLLDDYGCLHRKWPIICGVSVPTHDDEELAELKKLDNVKIEFEGEEFTRYEMSQIQRKIETRIRHAKDRQIIAAAAGDDELRRKEQEKINLLKSKYVKVSAAAGLPTKMERMSVRGYHRVKTVDELKKKGGKVLQKDGDGGKIKMLKVLKGLGAAAKNYPVKLADSNQHARLAKNQTIKGKTFAGKGTSVEIRERFRLESDYSVPAEEWEKVSGKGYLIVNGKRRYAELHWYEADGEIYEMKVKRYLDES